ncbi:MAG: hypothetical protein WAQ98_16825 [Blastocatellia bacterium]
MRKACLIVSLLLTIIISSSASEILEINQEQKDEVSITNNIDIAIKKFINIEEKKNKAPIEINKIIIGDINNDGKEDQLVQYNVNIGNPGNASILYIAAFLNLNGKFKFQTKMEAGNFGTATGRQLSLDKIENGVIYCKVYEYASTDGVCCPSIQKLAEYRFTNKKFYQIF